MIACLLYYIPFLLVFSYLLFASLCTRVPLSSLSFSLIRSLVSTISRSSLVTNIFNDQTAGIDSPVCSLGITTISPGVNALRLHGWRHPLLSYLSLVLFFHSASQPFSWCWCGPDRHTLHGPRAPRSLLLNCAEGALPLLACECGMNLVAGKNIRKG